MKENEAIKMLRSMQNPKKDYANLVCAPAFCAGYRYVYPEPEDYAIEEAISALEEIQRYREIGTIQEFAKVSQHIKDVPENNWIPVERKCPPIGQRCLATIKHHEWISNYDSDWVSDKDKIKYPEYTEVCEIAYNGKWNYMSKDYEISEACIKPEKNIAKAIDEIIAWKPLPEPYSPEKEVNDEVRK